MKPLILGLVVGSVAFALYRAYRDFIRFGDPFGSPWNRRRR